MSEHSEETTSIDWCFSHDCRYYGDVTSVWSEHNALCTFGKFVRVWLPEEDDDE